MARKVRRTTPSKRRLPTRRRAARRTAPRRGGVSAKARQAAEQRALAIFEQQIEPLWKAFAHECLQFAEGFNSEIRAYQLQIESNPDTVVARFASGGEVLVQLDRTLRHVACFISSGCTAFGSCIVEQPAVSLTIQDGQLRFVYGASVMAPDDLAVKLLTDLVQPEPEAEAQRVEVKT